MNTKSLSKMVILNRRKILTDRVIEAIVNSQNVIALPNLLYNNTKTEGAALIVKNPVFAEVDFKLIFVNCIHDFFNYSVTELPYVSNLRENIVDVLSSYNPEVFIDMKKDHTFTEFFFLFYNGALKDYITEEQHNDLMNVYNASIEALSYKSSFSLRLKDSSGNKYLETETVSSSFLKQDYAFALTVPIDDTLVTGKTGFDANEDVYAYIYFEHYDVEIPITLVLGSGETNITAIFLSNLAITEMRLDEKYNLILNPKYSLLRSDDFTY